MNARRRRSPGRQTPRVRDGRVPKKLRCVYDYNEYGVAPDTRALPNFAETLDTELADRMWTPFLRRLGS